MNEHLIVLIFAVIAAGVAYFELNKHRRTAEKALELDDKRFNAEQTDRDKRLELEERRFKAEETEREKRVALEERRFKTEDAERQNLVRFRESQYDRFSKPAVEIADHLTQSLCNDASWAARALQKARFLPYTDTIFGERSEHFHDEKVELAKQFTRYLLKRCEALAENERHVFLFVDAGTTLFQFFETIGKETVKKSQRGDKWLKRFHLATNNLPGIGELIKSGKRLPWDRYSKLAIEDCQLLPGTPIPIFASVAGEQNRTGRRCGRCCLAYKLG